MEGLGSRSGGTIARNAESLMRPSGAAHQHRVRANRVGLVRVGPPKRHSTRAGLGKRFAGPNESVGSAAGIPISGRRRSAGETCARSPGCGGSAASVRSASRSSSGPRTRGGRRRSLRPRRRRPPARPGACPGIRPRSRRGLRTTLQSAPRPAPRPVPWPVRGCVPPRGARVDSSEVVMTGKLP